MKDRYLMEGDPHQLVEGIAIAALATGARKAYIYLRREYGRCARAAREGHRRGGGGGPPRGPRAPSPPERRALPVRRGDGTAQRDRGQAGRPSQQASLSPGIGTLGRPTVVNNVETLCNLPHIMREGADWFKSLSSSPDGGTKVYGASGWVARPGLWELPLGATAARDHGIARAGCQRGEACAPSSRAGPRPTSSRRPSSTFKWTSTRSRPRARGWVRGR